MDNDDDFTFCQVAAPSAENGPKAKSISSDVDGMSIKDEGSNGSKDSQKSNILSKDRVPNSDASKEETVGSLSFKVIDAASLKKPVDLSGEVASKEETIGSLSFKVIDAASLKKPVDLSGEVATPDTGTKISSLKEPKASIKKPVPRAKVPFEKGYSQMDWLKLTRTHPDLAGLNGQSNKRRISLNEVKQHRSEGSMWTVLKGRVYNLSPYMKFHPGGVDMLTKAVGKDCTSLFNKYHAWVNDEFLLEKCLVGILDDGQ